MDRQGLSTCPPSLGSPKTSDPAPRVGLGGGVPKPKLGHSDASYEPYPDPDVCPHRRGSARTPALMLSRFAPRFPHPRVCPGRQVTDRKYQGHGPHLPLKSWRVSSSMTGRVTGAGKGDKGRLHRAFLGPPCCPRGGEVNALDLLEFCITYSWNSVGPRRMPRNLL